MSLDPISALLNISDLAGGVAWVNRDGAYQLLKQVRRTTGTWRLSVAEPDAVDDRGALVTFKPSMTRDSLYNAVVIKSEDSFGNSMSGTMYEKTGPLRWGGPFGRVPLIETNQLGTSNAKCQALAEDRYAQQVAGRSITVTVACLPNFAVDPLDTIELALPNRSIMGLVTSITYPLDNTVGLMTMQVSIPFVDWIVS